MGWPGRSIASPEVVPTLVGERAVGLACVHHVDPGVGHGCFEHAGSREPEGTARESVRRRRRHERSEGVEDRLERDGLRWPEQARDDAPVRPADPLEFPKGVTEFRCVLHRVGGEHHVELAVLEGEFLDVTDLEVDMAERPTRMVDHAGRRVHAGHVGARPMDQRRRVAGTAADVEHSAPGADRGGFHHGGEQWCVLGLVGRPTCRLGSP